MTRKRVTLKPKKGGSVSLDKDGKEIKQNTINIKSGKQNVKKETSTNS